MRIAICDDDENFLNEIEEKLKKFSFICRIERYSQIDCFFKNVSAGEIFDLVLLDLDWGQKRTGISYSEQLYKIAPHLSVIYVTGFNDRFAQQILLKETNLVGYLTKPIDDVLLEKYLRKVLDSRDSEQNFSFQYQGSIISIDVKQIIYVESQNHLSIIHTDATSYIVHEKLGNILSRLPDIFIQCHKSYIVNMRYIQRLDSRHILLQNGEQISVSRSRSNKTKEIFFNFLGLQM